MQALLLLVWLNEKVGFRGGEPPRVLVTAPIDTLAGVVVFGGLREAQYAVLVAHAAEQDVGVLEVLAQVACHACRRLTLPYAEVVIWNLHLLASLVQHAAKPV